MENFIFCAVIPNRLCNIPIVVLVRLTCLLKSMAKIFLEEVGNELKLVKVVATTVTGAVTTVNDR